MKEKEPSVFCYKYAVCWHEHIWDLPIGIVKQKDFAIKKQAQQFARKIAKRLRVKQLKPLIIRRIVERSIFRSDIKVESVKNVSNAYIAEKQYKLIKY